MDNYQIRKELYDADSLYLGFDPSDERSYATCYDAHVYADYMASGKHSRDLAVTLPRTLHDHSISDALFRFLQNYDPFQVVGVMGGHAMKRSDEAYRTVALISKRLTEHGKLMVSGGGPGAMEATHFGAWMAGRSDAEFDEALKMIRVADTFRDAGWLSSAFAVRKRFPQEQYQSLGIPTWFYGHEPSTPFATHIAKYYDNSIREDTILTVSVGGIIFTPGSAGTLQEVFQEAAQDHYKTCEVSSPMAFLGVDFFTRELPVYSFLQDMMARGKYHDLLLSISDEPDDVIREILAFNRQNAVGYHSKV
jgi:Predicted Rossmann fold nucleotide-binding protein